MILTKNSMLLGLALEKGMEKVDVDFVYLSSNLHVLHPNKTSMLDISDVGQRSATEVKKSGSGQKSHFQFFVKRSPTSECGYYLPTYGRMRRAWYRKG